MDVLVVGAGPVGLVAACELARHGVRCRIIDKAIAPSPLSKALAIHARTLEIFERMGVIESFIEQGKKVHGMNAWLGSDKHVIKVRFDELDSPYPYILDLPQSQTEKILSGQLQQYGLQVERGVELLGYSQTAESVTALLRHANGKEELVQTAWLIGTDGAHSTVRHQLNIPFEGSMYPETFVLADVRVTWDLTEEVFHLFANENSLIAAFPYGNQRYRLMADLKIEPNQDDKVPVPTLDEFQQIVDERCPYDVKISEPIWLAGFRTHLRHVKETRHGRVFLAGDASHIHSPAGGQGMNTGIQDTFNLAWKLALVVKGDARSSLLDTYPAERLPVAESVLKMSDAMLKTIIGKNAVVQKLRKHIAPFLVNNEIIQHRLREQISEIAIHYRNSPIVKEHRSSLLSHWQHYKLHAGDRAPDVSSVTGPEGREQRLYEILHDTKQALLFVFQNDLPDNLDLKSLEKWKHILELYCIVTKFPAHLQDQYKIIVDSHHHLSERYGLRHDSMLLIRPDGYIGFLSDSIDFGSLQVYLENLTL